ncbi:MAG TPA: DUF6049 family protein [Intrasporangium sp.]|uniref:DUF6049 family protein n=1 Tax=Intrasporangium sp. TaxID=1925024 RepID=UPI002D781A5C|nr:DUF6049 family protein [Intrasporangium sp.]HET7397506.1 DUF6049 family protein [Intrasporangium sp.]
MRARRWRRAAARLVATLCGGLVVAAGALTATTAAAGPPAGKAPRALSGTAPAATPAADRVVVSLSSVSPAVVTPGDPVTITGSVTAPASAPLTGVRVRLVQGRAGLDTREAVEAWATGNGAAAGAVLATAAVADLPAGGRGAFTLRLGRGAVHPAAPFAALPVALEVSAAGQADPVGVTRTFLAWHARKEYEPLSVATVVPLTLDPDTALFAADGTARVAAWESAVGPASRLQRILDGTRGQPVTFAVDPAVLAPTPGRASPAATTTPPTTPPAASGPAPSSPTPSSPTPSSPAPDQSGPAPATPTPTPTEPATPGGVVDATITRLAASLAAGLAGRDVWALPYADADLAATVGIDPTDPLVRDLVGRAQAVGATLGRSVRSDVLWPADGLLPPGREAGLRTMLAGTPGAQPAAILVNAAAITATAAYTPSARRLASGGTPLLAWDPRLSALLPSRGDASPAQRTQRYLAETLALLGERPGTPRTLLLAAPRNWDPDPAGLQAFLVATRAPWLTVLDASRLLDAPQEPAFAQQTPATTPTPAAPAPALTPSRLGQMAADRQTVLRVATVLRDGAAFADTYGALLDELASTRWRYRPRSWLELRSSVAAEIAASTSALKVVVRSVNFLAEHGNLQVTVENGLDFTVEGIRLVLAPTNLRMQVLEQPAAISVGPGSKTTVTVPVRAVAAGQADIRAFLTTADGTPIGQPATIPVAANPLDAQIYWIGGIIAGLVVIAGIVRTVLRGTSRIDEIGRVEARPGGPVDHHAGIDSHSP